MFDRMSNRQIRNFINGEFVEAKGDGSFDVIDPATEKAYAS